MTARAVYTTAIPFLLSRRAAGRLLGTDPSGAIMTELIASGRLPLIPFGNASRVALEDVQRIAREGFVPGGRPSRTRETVRRAAPGPGVGGRIRALRIAGVDP